MHPYYILTYIMEYRIYINFPSYNTILVQHKLILIKLIYMFIINEIS
jgi:hypothetical protein